MCRLDATCLQVQVPMGMKYKRVFKVEQRSESEPGIPMFRHDSLQGWEYGGDTKRHLDYLVFQALQASLPALTHLDMPGAGSQERWLKEMQF